MIRPDKLGLTERILVYGTSGVGKTRAWLSIAKLHQNMGSDAKFYIMDSDDAVLRMLGGDTFNELENLVIEPVLDWADYDRALDDFIVKVKGRPQDWIITDMISPAWEAAQNEFTSEFRNQNMEEAYLKWLHEGAKGWTPLDRTEWGAVNKIYKGWGNKLVFRTGCNLFATASSAKLGDSDEKDLRTIFATVGYKPEGQKNNPHRFHTIMFFEKNMKGEYIMTTVKDRERDEYKSMAVGDFSMTYLLGTAGWKNE